MEHFFNRRPFLTASFSLPLTAKVAWDAQHKTASGHDYASDIDIDRVEATPKIQRACRAALDILDPSASHIACHALTPHYRCKPDDVIKTIVDTDGLVGICVIPRFLGGDDTIKTFLDHTDYAVQTVGVDHVSIATDVGYRSQQTDEKRKKLPPDYRLHGRRR